MAKLTVDYVIVQEKKTYSATDLLAIISWMETIKTDTSTLTDVTTHMILHFKDTGRAMVNMSLTQTKTSFAASDLNAIRNWVKTNVDDTMPDTQARL